MDVKKAAAAERDYIVSVRPGISPAPGAEPAGIPHGTAH